MKLSKKDRLILINQYKILSKIEPEDEEHYKELISILENGYTIFYSEIENWISEDMPISDGKFVLDVLSLYRSLEDIKRTSADERINKHHMSIFRGFDGNNEYQQLSFTRFLILEQNKFSEQTDYLIKTDRFNSHSPMIDLYARMIAKWEQLGKRYTLSVEQALEILDSVNVQ
ncbi:YfbU family protein [Enterobacter hormaechei]|uniref:YfbU family protein n=1 Tax=Enterobacter hormaechei TaxID=158836 RepID=UPI001639EA08|nr:YfbU family protein [Enterobacter hormaechei]EIT7319457.1 YfbU family protein [Enterobacter hormaechei]MBE0222972.1 YfbU family protein [Enterobacter hormaechei]MBK1546020.1 YfbU family protein [Enterobacter hormaechei]MCE1496005.1 YfbU family protein [Enterobacter hormaechei]